jgi:hypothetical protein
MILKQKGGEEKNLYGETSLTLHTLHHMRVQIF